MGLIIEDGFGSGKHWRIDDEGRGIIKSIRQPFDEHINEESGKVWSISFDALNPAASDDYVVYIKNTGDTPISITDFRFSASAATRVNIHAVSGTAVGGSDLPAVSRNIGSASIPSMIIESGVDITGLTSDGTLFFIECPVADTLYHLRSSSNIIIPKGKAIAISVATGTANISGVVSVVEREE